MACTCCSKGAWDLLYGARYFHVQRLSLLWLAQLFCLEFDFTLLSGISYHAVRVHSYMYIYLHLFLFPLNLGPSDIFLIGHPILKRPILKATRIHLSVYFRD